MAEIHVLPVPSRTPAQLDRVLQDLTEAYQAGVNIGSRTPHIHAAGDVLLQLRDQLKEKAEVVIRILAALGSETGTLKVLFDRLDDELEKLANDAQQFSS